IAVSKIIKAKTIETVMINPFFSLKSFINSTPYKTIISQYKEKGKVSLKKRKKIKVIAKSSKKQT
ncbi:MAG: hypothetical protein II201_01660, partial [Clostridia bacterium]|nr:hypothetical protein [Clostridia bacterium]